MKKILFSGVLAVLFLSGCVADNSNSPIESLPDEQSSVNSEITSSDTSIEENNDDSEKLLKQQIQDAGCSIGAAIVDYVDNEQAEFGLSELFGNSIVGKEYPFLCKTRLIAYAGYELYAIVPADDETTITIYTTDLNEQAQFTINTDDVLFKGTPGESVVLRCNVSDIIPNTVVVATKGDLAYEYRPGLSLKDGWLLLGQEGCYDFSPDNSLRQ